MRRAVITFASLLLLLFLILFVFYLKKKKPEFETQRRFLTFSLKKEATVQFELEAHRILTSEDSVIFLYGKTITKFGYDLKSPTEVNTPYKKTDGNYYAFSESGINAFFNIDYKKMYLQSKTSLDSFFFDRDVSPENVIYNSNQFFSQINIGNKCYIEILNPKTRIRKRLLNINEIFSKELSKYKDCINLSLEGNFFAIDKNRFGFFFYRSGYFLLYEAGIFKKVKTCVNYPFIKFERRKLEGFKNAYSCHTENDIQVQLSACSDSNRIYMLSNIGDKTLAQQRILDIYDTNGNYLSSQFLPNSSTNSKPFGIGCSTKNLFIQYDDLSVSSFKL